MANLSDFMPHILPYVAGCSYPLAEQHLRNICIDFCMKAPIVQVSLDPVSVVANQREYDLEAPTGSVVHLILEAWFQGVPLSIYKTRDDLGINIATGMPTAIKQSAEQIFTLNYAPGYSVQDAITMNVSTKPAPNSTTVDDVLLNDYSYAIAMGTVSRLMMLPRQDFTDPVAAMTYLKTYEIERAEARIRAEASFGQVTSYVRPRSFI